MESKKSIFFNIISIHLILLVIAVGFEIYLRKFKYPNPYKIYSTGQSSISRDALEDFPLDGNAKFTTNSDGLRGPEFDGKGHQIVKLGSSTAVGWLLDDSETWNHYLQNELSKEHSVKVATAGLPGNRSVEHHMQAKAIYESGIKVDTLIVMLGGGDLLLRLYQGEKYRPIFLKTKAERRYIATLAFTEIRGPFDFSNLALIYELLGKYQSIYHKNPAAGITPPTDFFTNSRKWRREARKNDSLPTIASSLDELEFHQRAIAQLAKENNSKVLFLTQPSLWMDDNNQANKKFLWMGHGGNHDSTLPWGKKTDEYYSLKAIHEGIKKYNERVLQVATKLNLPALDLSSMIPPKTEYFFDGGHLTPKGSRLVAEKLHNYFKENGL